jgi:hypothetical protein
MMEMRRGQLGFGDALIAEDVSDLREDWMKLPMPALLYARGRPRHVQPNSQQRSARSGYSVLSAKRREAFNAVFVRH